MKLPKPLPPVLSDALAQHSDERREALLEHLIGGTSADYLSDWLKRAGTPVGATAIKVWRRSLA